MRRAAAFLAAALAAAPAFAVSGVGAAGAQTMEQVQAARPAALAEAYVAEASGADSLGYNPAGLVTARGKEVLALFHGGFAGDTFVSAAYAQTVTDILGLGAAVGSYNSGNVDQYNSVTGQTSPVSGQRDIMALAGFGLALRGTGVAVGAAGKFVRTQLIEEVTGNALAADMGIRWDAPWEGLSLAACAQNLGSSYEIGTAEEDVPFTVRAGAAYRFRLGAEGSRLAGLEGVFEPELKPAPPEHLVTFLGDVIWRVREDIVSLTAGAEYSFHGALALRVGYRGPVRGTTLRNGAIGLGAGATVQFVRLDYAAELMAMAVLHRVSLTLTL
jgi:hypothetical protein